MKKKQKALVGAKLTPLQKKEITLVKKILGAISESKFAYDEAQEKIDFEVVLIGLTSTDIDDVITIFSAFKNLKDTTRNAISAKDLMLFMDKCYTSVDRLSNVAEFGGIYHDIVTRFYINKEFTSMDDAAYELNIGSRTTFINRSNEAMLQLFNIWRCADRGIYIETLKKMLETINE